MIGDSVIWGGQRFRVRGADPAGVDPRCVYLEDASGKVIAVAFEDALPVAERRKRLSPESDKEGGGKTD
jgi:hypothetical protein